MLSQNSQCWYSEWISSRNNKLLIQECLSLVFGKICPLDAKCLQCTLHRQIFLMARRLTSLLTKPHESKDEICTIYVFSNAKAWLVFSMPSIWPILKECVGFPSKLPRRMCCFGHSWLCLHADWVWHLEDWRLPLPVEGYVHGAGCHCGPMKLNEPSRSLRTSCDLIQIYIAVYDWQNWAANASIHSDLVIWVCFCPCLVNWQPSLDPHDPPHPLWPTNTPPLLSQSRSSRIRWL